MLCFCQTPWADHGGDFVSEDLDNGEHIGGCRRLKRELVDVGANLMRAQRHLVVEKSLFVEGGDLGDVFPCSEDASTVELLVNPCFCLEPTVVARAVPTCISGCRLSF